MKEFLKFKKFITPIIIPILFWVGVVYSIITGFTQIVLGMHATHGGGVMVIVGIGTMLFGPIFVRITCELLIVFFSIHDTLKETRDQLKPRAE